MPSSDPILDVRHLCIPGIVQDLTFQLFPGQRLALIGESGSGKTLSALAIMQLFAHQGQVYIAGAAFESLPERQQRKIRGKRIAMVFQEPMTALDPTMTIGKQIRLVLQRHGLPRKQRPARVAELLTQVHLPADAATRYPHQLSGGQRQRVLIAMALAWNPAVLICDEPTTALDATAQRAIIELLHELIAQHNIALLFISHDLNVVAQLCTHAIVLQRGVVIEAGPLEQILQRPEHNYTQRLVAAAQYPLLPDAPSAQQRQPSTAAAIVVQAHNVAYHYANAGVTDINLEIRAGQRLGIVGGSGSGKTTLLHLLAGLKTPDAGSLTVQGTTRLIFQDPQSSLDPRMQLAASIHESAPDADVAEVLAAVGLEDISPQAYPHQLSGGQRQRVAIARAMAAQPDIVLADEPVSALDMTVRAQVLSLLDKMVAQQHTTLVLVSHDLQVIQAVCDEIVILDHGRIVEAGPTAQIFQHPTHETTKRLLAAIPPALPHAVPAQ